MAAKNRNTFEKLQRESLKKRKAELKRQRREERKNAPPADADPPAEDLGDEAGSVDAA